MQSNVQDVCGRNAIVHLAGLRALGLDTATYMTALQKVFGDKALMPTGLAEFLESRYITLAQYCILETAVIETYGSAHGLYAVGSLAHRVSFASDTISDLRKKQVGLKISSPAVAMYDVDKIAQTFNDNKWFNPLEMKARRCVFKIEYMPLSDGNTRTEVEDLGSLYYFVRGMMHGINLMWEQPDPNLQPRFYTVNVKPEDVLAFATPDVQTEWRGHELFIAGEKYGELVYLTPNERGDFLGHHVTYDKAKPAYARLGVRITREFKHPDKLGEPKTVLWGNEILRYDEPLANLLRLRWHAPWRRRVVDSLLRPFLSLGVKRDRRLALAQQTASVAETKANNYHEVLAGSHPPGVVDDFFAGKLVSKAYQTIVMIVDIVGSTALRSKHSPSEYMDIITKVVSDRLLIMGNKYGAHRYKLMGDGGISVFIDFKQQGLHLKIKDMLTFADELMLACEQDGYPVRVGLAIGEVIWGNQTKQPGVLIWEASGRAVDEAARLQAKGSQPGEKEMDGAITHGYAAISHEAAALALQWNILDQSQVRLNGRVQITNGDEIPCFLLDLNPTKERTTAPGTVSLRRARTEGVPAAVRAATEPHQVRKG